MDRRNLLSFTTPVGLAAFGLAACTRPIQNVERQNFATSGTLEQRQEQIRRAGAGPGWQTDPVRLGLTRATPNLRSHVAVSEIADDEQGLSIRYADSRKLEYDGTNIRKNDNGWIENPERAISQQPLPRRARFAGRRSARDRPPAAGTPGDRPGSACSRPP